MGPPDRSKASAGARPDAQYPYWVIRAREDAATRSALRAGGIDSMAYRAYPYLAKYWDGARYLQQPILLHAAAAASHLQVAQSDNGGGIGRLTSRLTQQDLISETTASARLLSVQQMPLRNAHRVFFSLLRFADGQRIPIDWVELYWTYRQWAHPVRDVRLRARRQILEAFHRQPSSTDLSTADQTLETS